MRKLHVYVDQKGEVVASGPAPDEIQSKATEGPIFAGFTPARGGEDLTLFEIVSPDDLVLQRNGDIAEYHSRLGEVVRARRNVRQLDYRKDLGLQELQRA